MHNKGRFPNVMFGGRLRPESAALAIMVLLLFLIFVFLFLTLTAQPAQGQSYRVIYNFTGGAGGNAPGGLIMDAAGNLYGTTSNGGNPVCDSGCGIVFKLIHAGSGWVLSPLHTFTGAPDGAFPGDVIFGPDGSLYGATGEGGIDSRGTVFSLSPPATACKTTLCSWTETVLHRFTFSDGGGPTGRIVFDRVGNLYGTTMFGGDVGWGTVYELTPSHGDWTESVLYSFTGGNDGSEPFSGVIFDQADNLYGTTGSGGEQHCCCGGCGVVFQLTPSASGWTEKVLYSFQEGSDGADPAGGLIFDPSGNLYGSTIAAGDGGGGTVFMLSPSIGNWTFTTLYSFIGYNPGPFDSLTMDAAGNLYGTTAGDGAYGNGNVFKLTRSGSGWMYTSLYDFTGGSDGGRPVATVILAPNGNLYGTTQAGGRESCIDLNYPGCGVIFEITP